MLSLMVKVNALVKRSKKLVGFQSVEYVKFTQIYFRSGKNHERYFKIAYLPTKLKDNNFLPNAFAFGFTKIMIDKKEEYFAPIVLYAKDKVVMKKILFQLLSGYVAYQGFNDNKSLDSTLSDLLRFFIDSRQGIIDEAMKYHRIINSFEKSLEKLNHRELTKSNEVLERIKK